MTTEDNPESLSLARASVFGTKGAPHATADSNVIVSTSRPGPPSVTVWAWRKLSLRCGTVQRQRHQTKQPAGRLGVSTTAYARSHTGRPAADAQDEGRAKRVVLLVFFSSAPELSKYFRSHLRTKGRDRLFCFEI